MNSNRLSVNSRRTLLHAAVVLTVLTAVMLMLSAQSFAATKPKATGQVSSPSGVYLRKSATTASEPLAVVSDNTSLKIYREVFTSKKSTSRKKVWYYVKTPDGKKGYVRSDLVYNIQYSLVSATVKSKVNIRKGPGTRMKKTGTLKKGKKVTVYLDSRPVYSTRGSSKVWYRIFYKGKYSYVCSTSIKLGKSAGVASDVQPSQDDVNKVLGITSNAFSKMTEAQFENYLTSQGFPEAYKQSLRTLHKAHPNWVFVAYNTGLNWIDVMKKETAYGVSLVHKSYPASYRSTSKNSFKSYKMAAAEGGIPIEELLTEEGQTAPEAAEQAVQEEQTAPETNEQAQPAEEQATGEQAANDQQKADAENASVVETAVTETQAADSDKAAAEETATATAEAAEIAAPAETTPPAESATPAETTVPAETAAPDAADFDKVKAALDASAGKAAAEPLTGTVVPETITVLLETKTGAPVLAELSKDAKVTIKAASVTTEQQEAVAEASVETEQQDTSAEASAEAEETETSDSAQEESVQTQEQMTIRWYAVEFDKSLATVAGSEASQEEAAPVYASPDQSEDKELEAANDAAANEIIAGEADDAESGDDAEEETSEVTAEETTAVTQALNADANVIRGYVRAEDINVVLGNAPAANDTNTAAETASTTEASTAAESSTATEASTAAESATATGDSTTTEAAAQEEAPAESTAQPAAETAPQSDSANETAESVEEIAVSSEAKDAYYQVESGWYNANANVVAYYLDPRNFLNEDRIYMFENLAYQSEYQTVNAVNKILAGTKLADYGFTANVFMNAGATYNISPVFLAARVRQETGGNSASVNGSKSGGTVVYNPFNIGAYGSDPVSKGLAYAKKMGWTTPQKAVNGGASYLASGYINKKQNTIYFQKFNVANGLAKAGTHQYMTNIMAPYSEANITKNSYTKLGITSEALGFVIPVYNNMPSKTSLPK